ncbi:hypothetical protein [Marinobacterium aestuarii]|nr:hypothetical protein [Marinobacterium aestuarii]
MKDDVALVYQITSINRAWKRAREQWGEDSAIALMLRERKSSLQARLVRDSPDAVYLRSDTDNTDGEPLYSVRLKSQVQLPNGVTRSDAEHMPVRLAQELFSPAELAGIVK